MATWFVDTSVAVPLVLASHAAHQRCNRIIADRAVQLAAHALLETYSVLTRLPGDARLAPDDAAILLEQRFGNVAVLSAKSSRALVPTLARQQITTYALIGVPTEIVD